MVYARGRDGCAGGRVLWGEANGLMHERNEEGMR